MLNRMERRGAVIAVLLLLFILASCGKKGPPLPPIEKAGAEAPALNTGFPDNNVQQA